jgi:hypothetical protein
MVSKTARSAIRSFAVWQQHAPQPRHASSVYGPIPMMSRTSAAADMALNVAQLLTTIARTAADLARSRSDRGHLGRFIDEAIRAQAVTLVEVAEAMKLPTSEVESMIAMDSQPASR